MSGTRESEATITRQVVRALGERFPQTSQARIASVVDGCVIDLRGRCVSVDSAAAAEDYARAVVQLAAQRLSFGTTRAPRLR